jgi:DNA-binding XRE family transcriptional regulator
MESDIASIYPPHLLFDQNSFQTALSVGISNAESYIFIESAYISVDGVKRFRVAIEDAVNRGVIVCVFVQEPRELIRIRDPNLDEAIRANLRKFIAAVDLLISSGAHVTQRSGTHLKLAVIDGRWVWGGSLNILSYTKWTEEEVYFWDDQEWAKRTIKRRRLNECDGCIQMTSMMGDEALVSTTAEGLALQLTELRKQAGLSQEELANRVGIDRKTLASIEKGRIYPRSDLLLKLYDAVGRRFVAVTPEFVGTLQTWMKIHTR